MHISVIDTELRKLNIATPCRKLFIEVLMIHFMPEGQFSFLGLEMLCMSYLDSIHIAAVISGTTLYFYRSASVMMGIFPSFLSVIFHIVSCDMLKNNNHICNVVCFY